MDMCIRGKSYHRGILYYSVVLLIGIDRKIIIDRWWFGFHPSRYLYLLALSDIPGGGRLSRISSPVIDRKQSPQPIHNGHSRTMAQTFSFAPEIEDEIFAWAARLLPSHAPSLSIISKRIQRQVETVMYETLFVTTVTLDPDRHWHELALVDRSHVRNIYLQTDIPKVAKLLLKKCTMLRHLAFLVDPHWLRGAGPWICPLSSTLLTFYTSRQVLVEMADSGVVFPNVKFLGVRVNPYLTRIPSLHWLPALETVKLELDGEAIPSSGWSLDVDTVVSSTSNLRLLVVDVNPEVRLG
ncbi:hypothetical protein DXG01_014273 [Tephrocybe rancida]|nr:hypothetical protein DXG01_014273 [Tephrocybe rancida]